MKKTLVSALALLILGALILVGCGAPKAPAPPTPAPSPTKPAASPTPTVAKIPMPWDEWPIKQIRPEWGWPKVFVTNGTATRYADAVAHAEILKKYVGIETQAVQLGSGAKGVTSVIKGDAHLNDCEAGLVNASYLGLREMEGTKPGSIGLLAYGTLDDHRGLIARTGSGIKTPLDLKGKRLAYPPTIPVFKLLVEAILVGYGMTLKDVTLVNYTDAPQLVDLTNENLIDAFVFANDPDIPQTKELVTAGKAYLVSLDADKANAVLKAEEGLYPIMSLPAGSFKGQDKEIICFGGKSGIFTHSNIPESLAYTIVRNWWEHLAEFQTMCSTKGKSYSSPKGAVDPATINAGFHPGVIRYYKEVGVWGDAQEKAQKPFVDQMNARLATFGKK